MFASFSPGVLAIASVIAISAASLAGTVLFAVRREVMQAVLLYVVSFSTGAILGDVFLHMLPEMAEDGGDLSTALAVLLGGIVFSFALEKVIRWRHCHILPTDTHDHCHHVGVMNLVGDGVHNFIDGIVIAASFLVSIPVGLSTTLAVLFHELPHEIGDMAILLHSGYTRRQAVLFNLLSGAAALLGTVAVLVLSSSVSELNAYFLPFAAGNLLYIAGADLIPELHRETRMRSAIIQLFCMLGGIAVMWLMLGLE